MLHPIGFIFPWEAFNSAVIKVVLLLLFGSNKESKNNKVELQFAMSDQNMKWGKNQPLKTTIRLINQLNYHDYFF